MTSFVKKLMAPLLLSTFALTAQAETNLTPDEVRSLYPMVGNGSCKDNETGERGRCYIFDAGDGDKYMVFTQYGKPVFMRFVADGEPYRQVWPTDQAGGQSL